jgi:hypothetical protein
VTRAKLLDKLKKSATTQLETLLESQRKTLSKADADRGRSDVCDNIWDMYIAGGIDQDLTEAGIEDESPAAERMRDAVHEHYLAAFDKLAAELLGAPKPSKPAKPTAKKKPAGADAALDAAMAELEYDDIRKAIEAGADPNRFIDDTTALIECTIAAHRKDAKRALEVLLKHGARLDLLSSDGWSALHYAGASNCREGVAILLAAGADPEAMLEDGRRPRDMATVDNVKALFPAPQPTSKRKPKAKAKR